MQIDQIPKNVFTIGKSSRPKILLSLLLLLLCLPASGFAADYLGCRRCHQNELDRFENRANQHIPFAQQNCAACHGAVTVAEKAPAKKTPQANGAKPKAKQAKVTWLADSPQAARENSFLLPSEQLGATLVVELRGERNSYPRREITLPLLAEVEELAPTGGQPDISGVEVLEIKRGVFLSVTIGWRTDVLTEALVQYGIKDFAQSSDRSKRLGRSHKIDLYNLKPDQDYQFQVVATDLFGRSRASESFTFSTAKPLEAVAAAGSETGSGAELKLQSSFKRVGTDYLVELNTDSPVAVFVGRTGKIRKQELSSPDQAPELAAAENEHSGLSSGTVLTIAACKSCHQSQGQTTHPVNVLPKPGMTIPPEYPTLPDGRITCASCHSTHSSDYEYLAIRPGRRELCVGCHKDML